MSYCDPPDNPGSPSEIHFGHPHAYESPDTPAITDGCRMRVVATQGPWRLLLGPLGGYYADRGDRHGWFSLAALNERSALAEFSRLVAAS